MLINSNYVNIGGISINTETPDSTTSVVKAITTNLNAINNEIVTANYAIAKFPIKITSDKLVFVGGANASDTEDLFNGRGETPDKPFATLTAAINFITNNYSCPISTVIFLLLSDITDDVKIYTNNIRQIDIKSYSNTIFTINGRLNLLDGFVRLYNISINGGISINGYWGTNATLVIDKNVSITTDIDKHGVNVSSIYMGGPNAVLYQHYISKDSSELSVNGSANVLIYVTDCAVAIFAGAISGNLIANKYGVSNGGRLYTCGRGANLFPATRDGYVASNAIFN